MARTRKPDKIPSNRVKNLERKSTTFPPGFLWPVSIVILGLIAYSAVFGFSYINWDEKRYLFETPMIRSLTMENIRLMFTEKVLNSYNPVVLLSFALDYEIADASAAWTHGVNVLFHVFNGLLVFYCLRAIGAGTSVAGIISIIFTIHPMQVEAVAWVASRKDVLYGFFFLAAWLSYIKYVKQRRTILYFISMILFVISLLCKVQAVVFPLLMFITDWILHRRNTSAYFSMKLPFIALSVFFGLIAIDGSSMVADKYGEVYNIFERLAYSLIAFGLYTAKLLFPIRQSAIYQFPAVQDGEYILLMAAGVLSVILLSVLFIKKLKNDRLVAGSILFYALSLIPVLHIVAQNSSLIYERFTYISGIGLFTALTCTLASATSLKYRRLIPAFVILLFCFLAYQRTLVWKGPEELWTDVIRKNPFSNEAFSNRGQYYESTGQLDLALADFNEAIMVDPGRPNPFNNRSVIYFRKKDFKRALADNLRVLQIDPEFTEGYANRGSIFYNLSEFDSALHYYSEAIKRVPTHAKALYNRGACYYQMKEYAKAEKEYLSAIQCQPDFADAYTYLGLTYVWLDNDSGALDCIQKARMADPSSDALRSISFEYIRRGNLAFAQNDTSAALDYYIKASKVMPVNAEAYYNIGGIYLTKKNLVKARENWTLALEANPSHQLSKDWLARTGK